MISRGFSFERSGLGNNPSASNMILVENKIGSRPEPAIILANVRTIPAVSSDLDSTIQCLHQFSKSGVPDARFCWWHARLLRCEYGSALPMNACQAYQNVLVIKET